MALKRSVGKSKASTRPRVAKRTPPAKKATTSVARSRARAPLAAVAEILHILAASPAQVQPVLDAIAESVRRLLDCWSVIVTRFDGEQLHFGAARGALPDTEDYVRQRYPMRPTPQLIMGRCILERAPINVADMRAAAEAGSREQARARGFRAALAVPMLSADQPVGAIAVSRREAGAFAEAEVALLRTLADQAAIAIWNAQLFLETKEALERQTATADILRVISGTPTDTRPVFDAIVNSTQRLIASRSVALLLRRDPNFVVAAYAGPAVANVPEAVRVAPLDPDENFPSRVILDGEILNIGDWESEDVPEHERVVAKSFGIKSGLMVPLLREGKGIGAIVVMRGAPGPYHEKEIALLRSFADQAVIAIENVRLFNETREALEQQRASAEVLKVISNSVADTAPVFDAIGKACQRLFSGDQVVISLVRGDGQVEHASMATSPGSSPELFERAWALLNRAFPRPLAEAYQSYPIRKRRVVHYPDMIDGPNVPESMRQMGRDQGNFSMLIAPMLWEGRGIGTVHVVRQPPRPFDDKEHALLATFADQAVIAIQNARLFNEIAEKSRQLEEASQHKSQFLASMSHELRTPLNAILGFNEMIIAGMYGEPPDDMKEPLADIQTSGKHLLRLINNVLDLAKIEAGRMELALVDYAVQDTVESVRATLRPLAAEKGLELLVRVPAELPLAHGDQGRISQCLMNIAGNSLKFTKAGKVEISVTQKDGLLQFRVEDTGIGIPPDAIGSLFQEFKQTDATIASEFGGSGLGLSITKKFIEMHGGRIWVESELGKGSTFIFEIPLRVVS